MPLTKGIVGIVLIITTEIMEMLLGSGILVAHGIIIIKSSYYFD